LFYSDVIIKKTDMSIKVHPYLNLNGKCREAMTFYSQCLDADLTIMTIGDSPMADNFPETAHDLIMHSTLVKDEEILIMASDMQANTAFVQGTNISILVECSSEEEIKTLFERLSKDGQVVDPLEEKFWGDLYGMCRDKFGVEWSMNYDKSALQSVSAESFDGL
jgi:PhnB protein